MGAALLVYAGITALLFHNLLPDVSTHLYSDLGDPLLNAAILAWNAQQWPLTEAWWNFPSYAPLTGVTAFTEHLLLTYPVASPLIWLTGNPVLAYNVVFLAAMPLNGLAAFALARELLAHDGVRGVRLPPDLVKTAALLAGLAYAFAPYQQVHLSHLQHMPSFGLPVALLWLHRYFRTGRRVALAGFGAGWLAAALANSALLVFVPLTVLLWCAWFVRPREWRRLVAPAIAAAIASIPLVPLLVGYRVRQAAYGFTREYAEIQGFSADMVGLLGMYHRALPWKGILPHDFEEGALFPGLATFALALTALVVAVRRPDPRPPTPDPRPPIALVAPPPARVPRHHTRRAGARLDRSLELAPRPAAAAAIPAVPFVHRRRAVAADRRAAQRRVPPRVVRTQPRRLPRLRGGRALADRARARARVVDAVARAHRRAVSAAH